MNMRSKDERERGEEERNWTVMRHLLALCDEGANDEVSDGNDGAEPWSEEDRQRSRCTATWFREQVLPAPKTRPPRATGEQVFTDERLWIELENDDEERQDAASDAIDSLAKLAALRAQRRGTSFIYERHHIYDAGLFEADVLTNDEELREAALDAIDDVFHVRGLIDVAEHVPTPEDMARAKAIRARLDAKLEAMQKALSDREKGGAP
jgi:hypothetical protein